ncbi:MAG TPA: hypothetical protein VG675_16495 [Bryobacteraceae bacterium]|nr:hypothetical protein [Bryobacteraceae bacterium]
MSPATKNQRTDTLSLLLAGLEAGMAGAFAMLLWLGLSSAWSHRSFWTAENLLATVFYGDAAIRRGFAWSTVTGLALYVSIYSLLGAMFAVAMRERLPRMRLGLIAVLFGLCWYYVSFGVIWRHLSPLVTLLHVQRATILGHVIYGIFLGRFPAHLPVEPNVLTVEVPQPVAFPEGSGEPPSLPEP